MSNDKPNEEKEVNSTLLKTEEQKIEKVTAPQTPSKKPKNPKRVAAGKRLAAMNKAKFEKIKAARLAEEDHPPTPTTYNSQPQSSSLDSKNEMFFWIAGGVFIMTMLGIGYLYKQSGEENKQLTIKTQPKPEPQVETFSEDF